MATRLDDIPTDDLLRELSKRGVIKGLTIQTMVTGEALNGARDPEALRAVLATERHRRVATALSEMIYKEVRIATTTGDETTTDRLYVIDPKTCGAP